MRKRGGEERRGIIKVSNSSLAEEPKKRKRAAIWVGGCETMDASHIACVANG